MGADSGTRKYLNVKSGICYLREVEGLAFTAITARIGISKQAAWQAYQRARRPDKPRKTKRQPHKYQ